MKKPGAWTRERIVREINALKDKGVDLSFRAMFRQGYGALVSMALFYYGSWRRAIEKAGLPYERIRKRQRWSKHRVVVMVKQLYQQGMDLSYKRLRNAGYGKLVSMGCYYFSNWKVAIQGAGLNYATIKKKPGPLKKRKRWYNLRTNPIKGEIGGYHGHYK